MKYIFLSKRTFNALARNHGSDFDLVALAERFRDRALLYRSIEEMYIQSINIWFGVGIGRKAVVEMIAELASKGFEFTDELHRDGFAGTSYATEAQLCEVITMLDASGYGDCSTDVAAALEMKRRRRCGHNKNEARRELLEQRLQRLDPEVENVRAELRKLSLAQIECA